MEKMNLARNIFKTVYGFRFRTIDQRFKNTAEEFLALSEECSKVKADPNIKNILSSSPKEAKHVCEVKQQCDESIIKLAEQYDHFKEHEEPNLRRLNMFRTDVEPLITTTVVCALVGATAYERSLKNRYQTSFIAALEKELSAETAHQLQG